jgi:hypothetical protein
VKTRAALLAAVATVAVLYAGAAHAQATGARQGPTSSPAAKRT